MIDVVMEEGKNAAVTVASAVISETKSDIDMLREAMDEIHCLMASNKRLRALLDGKKREIRKLHDQMEGMRIGFRALGLKDR